MKILFLAGLVCSLNATALAEATYPYGVCSHVTRSERETYRLNRTMASMQLAGMKYVRSDFDADKIIRPGGAYDFSHYDKLIDQLEKSGIKFLPILYGLKNDCRPPEDMEAYRAYIMAVVGHYGMRMPVVEIWNEANLDMFFKGADPVRYAEVLKVAYETIKRVNPNVRVAFTGTAGIPIDWIRKVMKAGAAHSFDIMNVHPYAHPGQPEGSVDAKTEELKKLLREFGREDMPIWFSEIGWPTQSISDKIDHAHVLLAGLKVARPQQQAWNVIVTDLQIDGSDPDQTIAHALRDLLPAGSEVKACTQKETIARLAAGGVDAVVYPFDESLPYDASDAVKAFVAKGGVLVDFGGAPALYGRRNAETVNREMVVNYPFGFRAFWMGGEERFPKSAQVFATEAGLAAGVKQEPTGFKSGCIYLWPDRIGPKSEWIPLLAGKTAKGEDLVTAAVIRYKGKYTGAAVLCSLSSHGSFTTTEENQARYTARSLGLSFAEGVEAYFTYCLRAREDDPFYSEDHFGLMHADFQPKPAFSAYMNFVKERPAGSVQKGVAWRNKERTFYYPQWTRPDGKKAGMLWTPGKAFERTIRFTGGTPTFRNMYGRKIAFREVEKGVFKVKVSDSPVYFSGAELSAFDK